MSPPPAEQVARHARDRLGYPPGTPLFLFGESLGGALALLAADRTAAAGGSHHPLFSGLILSGAATGPPEILPPPALFAALRRAAAALPRAPAGAGIGGEGPFMASFGDQEFARRAWDSDPLIVRRLPLGVLPHMLPALDASAAAGTRLALPLLLLHGDEDKKVSARLSRELHARAGACGDKTLVIYPGGSHQLLQASLGRWN
jgi:alpha-beta hydrolase superfamily lysophospholipase